MSDGATMSAAGGGVRQPLASTALRAAALRRCRRITDIGTRRATAWSRARARESPASAGDEYGEERLAEAALTARTQPVEAMKDALMADVNAYTGGKFDDDATLIVVGIS
jgi:hypothetical protein